MRRHRGALAAALLVALSLVGATTVSVHQARTALRERDRAERVVVALERILWSPNPDWYAAGGSAEITMATVLESAGKWLPESLADLPEEEARVRYSLGTTFASLGRLEASERELRRAHALHRQVWGDSHVETAKATSALGGILTRRGRHREAIERFRRVIEICESADCHEFLDYLVPSAYWALGIALTGTGDEAAAEEALRHTLELRRRQGYGEDGLSANILVALGVLDANRGKLAEAEGRFQQALEFAGSLQRAFALTHLGELRVLHGRLPEARRLIEEAHRVMVGSVGRNHYHVGAVEAELARIELREGAVDSARERIARALGLLESSLDELSRSLGWARTVHGEILLEAGEPEAAQRELQRAVDGLERALPADAWELAEARSLLGSSLVRQGRVTEGLELLESARDRLAAKLGRSDPRVERAAERLQ